MEDDYVVIKAKAGGVQVIGLTRGAETRFNHLEKLDKGDVMVCQFTEYTSAIKVRGSALVYTRHGIVDTQE